MKLHRRRRTGFLSAVTVLCLLVCIVSSGCGQQAVGYSKSGFYFDTIISITLYGNDDAENQKLINECFDMADRYEKLFSNTIDTSDISRINANPFTDTAVSEDTIDILSTALYYCRLSNGRFDITIGKLTDLWDFSGGNTEIPDSNLLTEYAGGVDYTCIHVGEGYVRLDSDQCKIDLGAIAKGYIADRMKEYLETEGVEHALINLGGNVLTIGSKPDGTAYQIGIQKPFSEDGQVITSVMITDQSVVTSGPYQRYFIQDDVVYHHILDPSTGYPIQNDLGSVSIISDSSVDCDALSTICYIYGLEEGKELIESIDGTEAIFVLNDDTLIKTAGLA